MPSYVASARPRPSSELGGVPWDPERLEVLDEIVGGGLGLGVALLDAAHHRDEVGAPSGQRDTMQVVLPPARDTAERREAGQDRLELILTDGDDPEVDLALQIRQLHRAASSCAGGLTLSVRSRSVSGAVLGSAHVFTGFGLAQHRLGTSPMGA
jgi:hypothetical protein